MATELAQAYVQIVPSAKGIKGSITQALDGEASSAGDAAGEKAGDSFVSKVKGIIAAAGIGAAAKEALSLGADLEQSIGGIETLFGTGGNSIEEYAAQVGKSVEEIREEYEKLKDSEETMLTYADQAYKTAGLSANDYMQTVTGFAASLKQSTGDDMEALTTAANQAVIDMADNANKMGTEMESIQNAYQGFAKQNYTMLDNLKLGYGGTKEEMQRLLADASKLSGIEYNLDNLADVYAAIHVIQDQLGITGTTAKEAATTFSGSLASMKSAVQNLLAKLTLGEDIKPSLQALNDSIFTFVADNMLPMVGNLLNGVPEMVQGIINMTIQAMDIGKNGMDKVVQMGVNIVSQLTSSIISSAPYLIDSAWDILTAFGKALLDFDWVGTAQSLINNIKGNLDLAAGEIISTDDNVITSFGQAITNALPQLLDKGIEIITNLVNGMMDSVPQVVGTVESILNTGMDFLSQNFPVVLQKGSELAVNLITGIGNKLPDVITSAGDVLNAFVKRILDGLPDVLGSGIELIRNLAQGIASTIPDIITAAVNVLDAFINYILGSLPAVLEKGTEIVAELSKGIVIALPYIITSVGDVIAAFVGRILESLPEILDKGLELVLEFAKGIVNAIPNVVEAVAKVIMKLVTTIIEHFPEIVESGFKLLGSLITGIINCIPSLVQALPKVVKAIINAFTSVNWIEVGANILEGIKNGIVSAVSSVVDAAKNAASSIYNAVKDFFRIGSPSKLMRDDIGHWLPPGIAVGIEDNLSPVEKAMGELEDTVMTGIDMDALNIASDGSLSIETDRGNVDGKLDELMTKMEDLAEYLITEVSNLQLVAMVDKDDVFSSVRQSAQEYKEQTRRPAFG